MVAESDLKTVLNFPGDLNPECSQPSPAMPRKEQGMEGLRQFGL